MVCTKAIDSGEAQSQANLIEPVVVMAHTSIVVIQNGLGVERIYHEAFPENTIISGVTYLLTSQVAPGVFSHTETQKLHLGPFPADTATTMNRENTETFAKLLRAAGADAMVHNDVQVER